MSGDGATMGAYATAIELGFDANLLLSLWAVILFRFERQLEGFREALAILQDGGPDGEEISKRRLRSTIDSGVKAIRGWWWVGLGTGITSALFFYGIVWFGGLEAPLDNWWTWLIWPAAFASPLCMTIMALIGRRRSKDAKEQVDELKREQRRVQAQGRQAFSGLRYRTPPSQPPP